MPQGLRVLIVEDVPVEAELVVRQLADGGIPCAHLRVDTEESFRAALLRFRPHIILSDFTLPAFDGLSALDIARHEAPHIPFIFVSGTIGEERAIEALKRGAVDYVLKTNPARLVPAVRRALREVSERVRRLTAERHIRDSEQRLRDIVDTAQDWIWELDSQRRYVFSSESVRGALGHRPLLADWCRNRARHCRPSGSRARRYGSPVAVRPNPVLAFVIRPRRSGSSR